MAKIQATILVCVLFGVFASAVYVPIKPVQQNVDEVLLVDSIENFIEKNPSVNVIALEKTEHIIPNGAKARQPIRYTLGNRVPRDRVLTTGQNSYSYPQLQDVSLQLNYPQHGTGGIVSFVEIIVEQSSGIGQAYIVGGGINQRSIRIIVEAKQTAYFNYRALFYGY